MNAKPTSQRILELDALRGLAALAVVFFHYTARYEQLFGRSEELLTTVPWGHYGVDLFFMLSGFVILMTLERTADASRFAWGRFTRLYPTYWAAAAVTFVVVTACGLPGQEVSWPDALLNLTMVQSLLGGAHIDGAYWSLQAELIFYANMLLLFSLGCFKRPLPTVVGWLTVALAANLSVEHIAPLSKLITITSCKYIPLFAMGIVLYHARQHRDAWRQSLLALGCCLGVAAALDGFAAAAVDAALALLLWSAISGRLPALALRPLVFLGALSYALYLVHQNVGYVVIQRLEQAGVSPNLAILAAVSVALCLAVLLHFVVERPAMGWLRTRQPTWPRRYRRVAAGP